MFVVATWALAPFPVIILSKGAESGSMATYWAYFTSGTGLRFVSIVTIRDRVCVMSGSAATFCL